MWNGSIDARHLYAARRLRSTFYDRRTGKTVTAGLATGFVVGPDNYGTNQKGYLVTNRHVVDPSFRTPKNQFLTCESLHVSGYFQDVQSAGMLPVWQELTLDNPSPVYASNNVDLAVIDLNVASSASPMGQARMNWFGIGTLAGPHAYDLGEVTVGNNVVMPGYPALDGVSAERPILVGGVIASDPRFDGTVGGNSYPESVLCHAFSWGGMSGAPVLAFVPMHTWGEMEGKRLQLALIGINSGHIASSGSSSGVLSHFVKSLALLQILVHLGESQAQKILAATKPSAS